MGITTSYSLQLLGNADVLSVNGRNGGFSTNPETVVLDGQVFTAIDDADTDFFGNSQITVRTFDSAGTNNGISVLNGSDPSVARMTDGTLGLVGTQPDGNVAFWKFAAFGSGASTVKTVIGSGGNADVAAPDFNYGYAVAREVYLDNGYSNIAIHLETRTGFTGFIVKLGAFYDRNPSVAYLGNGNIVVAWDRTSASGNSAIWYTVLDGQGNTVTAATEYDAGGSRNVKPSVVASRDGFTIAYEDSETGESQIAIFNRTSDGRNSTYTRTGASSGPDSDVSTADLGGTYVASYTRGFLDGEEVRETDIYLTLIDPATGAVLTDPANPLFVAGIASDSSVAVDPERDGRIVVSYYSEHDGYVRQQTANVVATITGDSVGQFLAGRPGVAVAIDGGGGNDTLFSSDGDDRLLGNTGDDFILVSRGEDYIDGGRGTDTLDAGGYGPIIFDLTKTGPQDTGIGMKTIRGIENLKGLSTSRETFIGNDLANVLDAGGIPGGSQPGLDTLVGNGGNDTYIINRPDTVVRETSASGGTDLVQAEDDFTLPTNVENLTLLHDAYDDDATGNGLANIIIGNSSNNKLDGKAGADAMSGGGGSDTYVVDNAGDTVGEANVAGTDTVQSSVSFSLKGRYVEILTLTGSGNVNATGNTLANTIAGNSGNNIIDGGENADAMGGRGGNDTYVVDNAGDTVGESSGAGTDTVLSSVSFSLKDKHVEILTLTGSGNVNATGNTLANTIAGNTGANALSGGDNTDTLKGKEGKDALTGGAGNDTFHFDTTPNASTNFDAIVDFSNASGNDDRIVLANSKFQGIADGALADVAFKNVTLDGPVDSTDRIIYSSRYDKLYWDRDGSGTAYGQILFADLANETLLTNDDFFVI